MEKENISTFWFG